MTYFLIIILRPSRSKILCPQVIESMVCMTEDLLCLAFHDIGEVLLFIITSRAFTFLQTVLSLLKAVFLLN